MIGVSIEDVKEEFRKFINRVSEMKRGKLNKEQLDDFSIQVQKLARLLELKAFIPEVEELDKVKKSVSSKKIIEDEDVNDLKRILSRM